MRVSYIKTSVDEYRPDVDPSLLQSKDLVLKTGELYKFKIDPGIILAARFVKLNNTDNNLVRNKNIMTSIDSNLMFNGQVVIKKSKRFNKPTTLSNPEDSLSLIHI